MRFLAGKPQLQQNHFHTVSDLVCVRRTGNAVKNRWNWMMSPKREDILDTIVTQNKNLFRAIYQVDHYAFLICTPHPT
jgi:hypothetical protein